MPIFGQKIFGHNSVFSAPIGLNIFKRVKETIIYRLVMRNPSDNAYFSFLIFWATFGGKIGVAKIRMFKYGHVRHILAITWPNMNNLNETNTI